MGQRNFQTPLYLILRLGLPPTLIRHENRTFLKLFKQEEFENAGFAF